MARQPTLAYAARHHEDRNVIHMITDTLFIHSLSYFALKDIRSTHSYVASIVSVNLGILVKSISGDISVISFLGVTIRGVDLILGMVYLVEHQASSDYAYKRVTLRFEDDVKILMVGEHINYLSNVIYILDIQTVKECSDVFHEELLRLPSDREVEFNIEVLIGSALVPISPYRMASKELMELKVKLQELPSVSL
ncbi:uncharacterized protein [Gossypium hirsutum]|uniref:Uncharacterized protein n=1 Tax=Gossypium hirsutum TaxID=3635 RepID=A0A1U8KTR8_GOSHI|nr:uncharacterized protein LOC107919102 [Gossypium hirsutum]